MKEQELIKEHFDKIAPEYDAWKQKNAYYYDTIKAFVHRCVRPGSRVLEIGCATGEILNATRPAYGVGIDVSPKLIEIAAKKFPEYTFINQTVENYQSEEKFDYIILADVIHHVYDIMTVFEKVYGFCHPRTKILITVINPWWGPFLKVMEKFKAKTPDTLLNYFERRNIGKILELLDFSVVQMGCLLLLPKRIPLLSYLANSLGVKLWGINKLSFVQYMIVQPALKNTTDLGLGCSVIIPCFNEEENIVDAIKRIPQMGKRTEVIVVNDGSLDRTAEYVKGMQKEKRDLRLIDYKPNKGKGNAIREGFEAATEEIIMILDADMTVAPEELPRFFEPLNKGICQFVNGTRLVYPQENQSMRFLNQLGNKVFSLIMTFITNQTLTDTLCGTKAMYKQDSKHIHMGLDKWGDFDLLFGAAKVNSKILEVPVHYKSRKSGRSKMKSFRHGIHLLWACFMGFRELVFIPRPGLSE
ncbi:MAG: glycosyltransferase [Candidatus Omnitrophica bacterium]|nr:glycosyltransferase [Candidatus Omnitrophota bacterium]